MSIMWHLVDRTDDYLAMTTEAIATQLGSSPDVYQPFPRTGTHAQKRNWLVKNASEAKRHAMKMNGMGHKNWLEYLYHYKLEEQVKLVRVN